MNCREFDLIVVDLARGTLADSTVATRCWVHAANCSRCAERLLEQEKLSAGFEALAALSERERAPERIEAGLRGAFQAQRCAAGSNSVGQSRFSTVASKGMPSRNWQAWAIAAALLLAATGATIKSTLRSTPADKPAAPQAGGAHQPREEAKAAQPALSIEVSATQEARAAKQRSTRRNKGTARTYSRTRTRQTNPPNSRDLYATNFFALPYGSGLSLDDGWEIVRVSIPRSELTSLGVPVINEQASAEIVKADVLLGQDGLARAIRFVQ